MEKIQTERFEYLISKYADSSFMYTEYPHKSFWSKEFGEEGIKEAFINVYAGNSIVLHFFTSTSHFAPNSVITAPVTP